MTVRPEELVALRVPRARQTYGWRDCALYALGVGYGLDPMDERQLRFLDETRIAAAPTMAVVLAYPGFWMRDLPTGIDWANMLHGEQGLRVHAPLPAEGEVYRDTRIRGIVDKGVGKGALLYLEEDLRDVSGALLATLTSTVFCRGDGGCGSSMAAAAAPYPIPSRPPDLAMEMATYPQQALLYRLSGDLNPLHSDPEAARRAGYDRPILQGLAGFGIAGHALLAALCGYDPRRFKALDLRFTGPVFPGEVISFSIWRESRGLAAFTARVEARQAKVLGNGRFEYEA